MPTPQELLEKSKRLEQKASKITGIAPVLNALNNEKRLPRVGEPIPGTNLTYELADIANLQASGPAITSADLAEIQPPKITQPNIPSVPKVELVPDNKVETPSTDLDKLLAEAESSILELSTFDKTGGIKAQTEQQQKRINEINKQFQQLEVKKASLLREAEKREVLEPFAAGAARRAQEEIALQQMNLNIEKAALQGEIALAQQIAKDKVEAEFARREAEANVKRANILANYDLFSPAQKRKADALLLQLGEELSTIQSLKEDKIKGEDLLIQVAASGKATAQDIANIRKLVDAGDIVEATRVAAPFLLEEVVEKEKVPSTDIAEFKAFFPNVDITTSEGRQQFLNFLAQKAAATRKPETPASEKPPTVTQQLIAGYAARIEQAESTLKNLEDDIAGMNVASFELQKKAPAAFQSAKMQQYMQAARNFINAVLRRESGAVISESEFSEARKQYLPSPGDTKETLRQKELNRKIVFENYKRAAGSAFTPVDELLNEVPPIPVKREPVSDEEAEEILRNISEGKTPLSTKKSTINEIWNRITSFLGF